ncbi:hypothetical protein EK21DRAFT_84199 [Setomelanomma holmii]|uniref:Uncharacterized protein n=1 Tax=Setomelanomma holmii TaxID=210430 RepID=A0A9P4LQ50_9PLEO|nr:hypothetical protein EK21DRAFT_84199 [Setomelanomma holmii]
MSDTTKTEGSLPTAPDANAPKQTSSVRATDTCSSTHLTNPSPLPRAILPSFAYVPMPPPYTVLSNRYYTDTNGNGGGRNPNFFAGMTCVNVRMLDGVDVKSLKIKFADGKNYKPEE